MEFVHLHRGFAHEYYFEFDFVNDVVNYEFYGDFVEHEFFNIEYYEYDFLDREYYEYGKFFEYVEFYFEYRDHLFDIEYDFE